MRKPVVMHALRLPGEVKRSYTNLTSLTSSSRIGRGGAFH